MKQSPKLSIVIITLNEAHNIPRLLESVKGMTDDVVVVDSGSTDATVQLCMERGARVVSHRWEGYAATKNFANALAKYPWILSLDADEAVSPRLRQSIEEQLGTDWPENRVYAFNRLASYCGRWIRHGGWYPDRKIRIWHRNFTRWEGKVHEKLVFGSKPEVVFLQGDLLHYTYYTVAEHRNRAAHYASLHAEAMAAAGKKGNRTKQFGGPVVRFLRDYLLKGGFLDGKAGFTIACISASAVYQKYYLLEKMRNLNR
ncbi:MAG TPA: glycosyltransferase family 2 protein [Bacteroidales bacterium]|nr:glycosyltransferase family 2 protein [Bacteroidales bacterium]HRZ49752.1 glycosyltransferase family 2 protein [Bacteroidales bacterium]